MTDARLVEVPVEDNGIPVQMTQMLNQTVKKNMKRREKKCKLWLQQNLKCRTSLMLTIRSIAEPTTLTIDYSDESK
jgi:hypothetical protein